MITHPLQIYSKLKMKFTKDGIITVSEKIILSIDTIDSKEEL